MAKQTKLRTMAFVSYVLKSKELRILAEGQGIPIPERSDFESVDLDRRSVAKIWWDWISIQFGRVKELLEEEGERQPFLDGLGDDEAKDVDPDPAPDIGITDDQVGSKSAAEGTTESIDDDLGFDKSPGGKKKGKKKTPAKKAGGKKAKKK